MSGSLVDNLRMFSQMLALAPEGAPAYSGEGLQQEAPVDFYSRNQQWVTPGDHVYNTALSEPEEAAFRAWTAQNNVPFDADASVTDYDMRGFWKAMQSGDPRAQNAIDPFDNQLHYPDVWKTPYHETFSSESQWAKPDAPSWDDNGRLIDKSGGVLFSPPAPSAAPAPPALETPAGPSLINHNSLGAWGNIPTQAQAPAFPIPTQMPAGMPPVDQTARVPPSWYKAGAYLGSLPQAEQKKFQPLLDDAKRFYTTRTTL